MKKFFPAIQKLGRSLMLPIAVLPVAGLLLRLGQPDLLDLPYVAAAGAAVFDNLGLLFAIGVGVGLARGNNGAAGLAAVVAFLVTAEGASVLIGEGGDEAVKRLSVPIGLICGLMAGAFYNRFSDIRLPDYLAFFAGRRFVPIVSGFAALLLAAAFGFGWPFLEHGMNALSDGVVQAGGAGLFVYGLLNRLLIITGLHHILNNIAWFIVGDFEGVTGDLRRFFAGDPSAGAFMTGFFPIMMFGLPAACLAMYQAARPEHKKAVGGLFLSMALTSFLTGITEPIEFTFMFLAPALYAIHAVLTGLSMAVMELLGAHHGFGFSAGLFDFILNYNKSTQGWMILPVGAVFFAIYYGVFRWFIVRFNVPTPGRAEGDATVESGKPMQADSEALALIDALGGASNLVEVDACTTRLRLNIVSQDPVDEARLKSLGAAGVLRPTAETLQVIMGLRADEIASNIRRALAGGEIQGPKVPALPMEALFEALGGAGNVRQSKAFGPRLAVEVEDESAVDEKALLAAGFRGLARLGQGRLQVLAATDFPAEA